MKPTAEDFNQAFKEYKKEKDKEFYYAVEAAIISVIIISLLSYIGLGGNL
jgi:hypothetical protein